MCIQNWMLTHDNTSVMTSLSFIPLSNASFSYKLIDERKDNQGCNRLRKQSQKQDEYLEFGQWGPFTIWHWQGGVGVNIWILSILCQFMVCHWSSRTVEQFPRCWRWRISWTTTSIFSCGIDSSWLEFLTHNLCTNRYYYKGRTLRRWIHLVYRGDEI